MKRQTVKDIIAIALTILLLIAFYLFVSGVRAPERFTSTTATPVVASFEAPDPAKPLASINLPIMKKN